LIDQGSIAQRMLTGMVSEGPDPWKAKNGQVYYSSRV